MIRLNCPQCREELEIDDAFLGGICRCSHCGAMITVPSDLEPEADIQLQRLSRQGGDDLESVKLDMPAVPAVPATRRTVSSTQRLRPGYGGGRRRSSGGMAMVSIGIGFVVFVLLVVVLVATQSGGPATGDGTEKADDKTPVVDPYADREIRKSLTLDDYRKAIPDADETFLLIMMNRDRTLEQAKEEWERQKQSRP